MKIAIESTDVLTTYNGGRVRMWKGTTESGVPCTLYVACVEVDRTDDTAQFEHELQEMGQPSELRPLPEVFDMRMF